MRTFDSFSPIKAAEMFSAYDSAESLARDYVDVYIDPNKYDLDVITEFAGENYDTMAEWYKYYVINSAYVLVVDDCYVISQISMDDFFKYLLEDYENREDD